MLHTVADGLKDPLLTIRLCAQRRRKRHEHNLSNGGCECLRFSNKARRWTDENAPIPLHYDKFENLNYVFDE